MRHFSLRRRRSRNVVMVFLLTAIGLLSLVVFALLLQVRSQLKTNSGYRQTSEQSPEERQAQLESTTSVEAESESTSTTISLQNKQALYRLLAQYDIASNGWALPDGKVAHDITHIKVILQDQTLSTFQTYGGDPSTGEKYVTAAGDYGVEDKALVLRIYVYIPENSSGRQLGMAALLNEKVVQMLTVAATQNTVLTNDALTTTVLPPHVLEIQNNIQKFVPESKQSEWILGLKSL